MVQYQHSPKLENDQLNELFRSAWDDWTDKDFQRILARSLGFVGAFDGRRLVGFVNIAWDGGAHAFLLDTTVLPAWRRRGIGTRLVQEAVHLAKTNGVEWLHVDFEPHLSGFYSQCGFRPTDAGLIHLV